MCRVGTMGVCVWDEPVGVGVAVAGRGWGVQRQWPRDTARQRTTQCVCVLGVGGSVWCAACASGVRTSCVCVCTCLGSGCVCALCAGGVCVRVCVRCVGCRCGCGCGCGLWVRGVTVAQRQRPRDTARQRTRQCVGGRGGRDVCAGVLCALVEGCLWAGLGVASACGVWAETEGRRRVTAGPRTT